MSAFNCKRGYHVSRKFTLKNIIREYFRLGQGGSKMEKNLLMYPRSKAKASIYFQMSRLSNYLLLNLQ